MRQLIVRLGLNAAQFLSKLGITKQAAKAFGKEFGKSLAMGYAQEKIFDFFRKDANTEMAKVEADVGKRSTNIKRLLAGGFVAGATLAIGKSSLDSAKRFKDLMDQTGKGAQEVQEIDNAMKRNGQTMEGFVGKLDTINEARKDAVEKSPELRDTFRDFGVTLDDLRNPMLTNLDLAKKMGVALQGMSPTAEQRNALRDLLGKGGEQFLNALKGLGDKSPLDIFANETAIKNIDRANTLIGQIWQNIKNIGTNVIGGALGKLFGAIDGAEAPSGTNAKLATVRASGKLINAATFGLFDKLGGTSRAETDIITESGEAKLKASKNKKFIADNQFGGKDFVGPMPEGSGQKMFRLQEEKELGKLAFELAEQQKKTDFERLSRLGKEKSLQKEIIGLLDQADDAESTGFPVEAAEARNDAEKKQNQLDDLQRSNIPGLKMPFAADSLAQNNRLVGGAATDTFSLPIAIAIQRESLTTLKSIDKKLTPSKGQPGTNVIGELNKAFR